MWTSLAMVTVISAATTWVARRYALSRKLVDEPGERRSHAVATPRGGGVGPVVGFALAIVVAGTQDGLPGADWRWILASLLAVAGIGAWDDHRPLGAGIRLLVHALAGAVLAGAFGLWGRDIGAAVGLLVGAVVLINVWNFMDGIDGIATTQAAIVAAAIMLVADGGWWWLALAFTAAVLAFLPFNFPRARIFLGDVGSGTLGLALAALAQGAAHGSDRTAQHWLLVLPAAPFLADASLTLGRRVLRGEQWWTAHTQHLYQVLARRHGHVAVTAAYSSLSLVGAIYMAMAGTRGPAFTMASVLLWYTACAALWALLQHRSTRWSEAA